MQDNTTNVIEVVRIACKYIIRRAFKLFDNETRLPSVQRLVTNLRLTSKDLNNSICDELSLEIMHRWMKGRDRCARVSQRIQQLLQKNEGNGLLKFMDAVSKILSKREAVRLLSPYLLTITQHHTHILKEYMEFFTSRKLHMTIQEYFSSERTFPFPGFTPQQVEKSLQIANENGWIEESLLLFDHLANNYFRDPQNNGKDTRIKIIKDAIRGGKKLHFDEKISDRINAVIQGHTNFYAPSLLAWLLLGPKQSISTMDLNKVLHSVTPTEANQILQERGGIGRIISFQGSELVRYIIRRSDYVPNKLYTHHISPSTKTFNGLPVTSEYSKTVYVYYFYKAVVENDLEKANQLQEQYDITVSKLSEQPHLLSHYLDFTDQMQQQTVDYLTQNFDVVKTSLMKFHHDVSEEAWRIIKPLIDKGATINTITVWERLLQDNPPRNSNDFQVLLDKTSLNLSEQIIYYLLEKFRKVSVGMVSETKILLLLAWRYDSTCHLSKIPKELLKVIVGFMNEPPLFIQCARMVVNRKKDRMGYIPVLSAETIESSGEIAKFVRDYAHTFYFGYNMVQNYAKNRIIKRDLVYLRDIFMKNKSNTLPVPDKILYYFCKYETDEQILRIVVEMTNYFIFKDLLERAVIAKNIKFLQVFYKVPSNINFLPDEDKYNRIIPKKRKKMSFEEALVFVNQVRRVPNL